jgi:hypothetical protein
VGSWEEFKKPAERSEKFQCPASEDTLRITRVDGLRGAAAEIAGILSFVDSDKDLAKELK